MKPIYLLPIPFIAIGVGWLRQPELEKLKRENVRLEQTAVPKKFRSENRTAARAPLTDVRQSAIHDMVMEIVRTKDESPFSVDPAKDIKKKLAVELSGLSHSEVILLIERSAAGTDSVGRENLINTYVSAFVQSNPREALALVLKLKDVPLERSLALVINRCIPVDPLLAIQAFDKLESEGSTIVFHPIVPTSIHAARARVDPENAISLLLSPKGVKQLDSMNDLPSRIADELRNPEEHRKFLAALRTQAEKFPDAAYLKQLRAGYVTELQRKAIGWPADEAIRLAELEFTPEEKKGLLPILDSSDEPGAWVDWVAKLDWNESREHPIGGFVRNWMQFERATVRAWLDKQPEGSLRNTAVKNYSLSLAETDPAEAADAAMMLPAGPERSHAFAVVRPIWKKRNPSAWVAFAEERGLKK